MYIRKDHVRRKGFKEVFTALGNKIKNPRDRDTAGMI